jgi:hypothetical protein
LRAAKPISGGTGGAFFVSAQPPMGFAALNPSYAAQVGKSRGESEGEVSAA